MAQTETSPALTLPQTPGGTHDDPPAEDVNSSGPPDAPQIAEEPVTQDMIDTTTPVPARRATKFMADLSRAMQTAAETSRDETMARFLADSKAAIEGIQAGSADEAAALRRQADDDVAGIREWSKSEMARIREETEARIAARKTALDGEVEAHEGVVERRVQRVGATVEAFKAEMDEFFARLLAEEDPTRIATMAEAMPDPPDLAGVAASIVEPTVAPFDPRKSRLAEAPAAIEPEAATDPVAPEPEPASDPAADAEAAMAARLEFAAAEAEALAFTGDADDEDGAAAEAPEPAEQTTGRKNLTNDLANADGGTLSIGPATARKTTRVVVLGLVSVASIATFKRGLTRSAGVASVGVASGPDGEFVFTVAHDAELRISDTVTGLPGFEAQITAESDGTLEVTAHDPDPGE